MTSTLLPAPGIELRSSSTVSERAATQPDRSDNCNVIQVSDIFINMIQTLET